MTSGNVTMWIPEAAGSETTLLVASMLDIGAETSPRILASGSGANITSFGSEPNRLRFVRFDGPNTITATNGILTIAGGASSLYVGSGSCVFAMSDVNGIFTAWPINTNSGELQPWMFGAVGNGDSGTPTNDTVAIQTFIAAVQTSGWQGILGPLTYLVDTITFSGVVRKLNIRGQGRNSSILKSRIGNDVLLLGTGSNLSGCTLRSFGIQGPGSASGAGSGSGIHITATAAEADETVFEDLLIQGFRVSGIFDEVGIFSTVCRDVVVNDTGSHNFDFLGGAALTFDDCYGKGTPNGAGKAAFRVHGGTPAFSGCNGVLTGDYWGIFGEADHSNSCLPTFDHCTNMEDFKVGAVLNYNDSIIFKGGSTVYGAISGTYYAFKLGTFFSRKGEIEDYNKISLKPGSGAWTNGIPIHTDGTNPLFNRVGYSVGTAISIRDDANSVTYSQNTDTEVYGAGLLKTYKLLQRLQVDDEIFLNNGSLRFPGTQVVSSNVNTLDDYERGTWTPVLTGSTPPTGVTYSLRSAAYTKIGDEVTVTGRISLSSKGAGGSGAISITGLPFACGAKYGQGSIAGDFVTFGAGATQGYCNIVPSGSALAINCTGSNIAALAADFSGLTNATDLVFTAVYKTT